MARSHGGARSTAVYCAPTLPSMSCAHGYVVLIVRGVLRGAACCGAINQEIHLGDQGDRFLIRNADESGFAGALG